MYHFLLSNYNSKYLLPDIIVENNRMKHGKHIAIYKQVIIPLFVILCKIKSGFKSLTSCYLMIHNGHA